jgi:hypothetical protein
LYLVRARSGRINVLSVEAFSRRRRPVMTDEGTLCEAIRIAKEQKAVSLEKRAEATYAEYRRQKSERVRRTWIAITSLLTPRRGTVSPFAFKMIYERLMANGPLRDVPGCPSSAS